MPRGDGALDRRGPLAHVRRHLAVVPPVLSCGGTDVRATRRGCGWAWKRCSSKTSRASSTRRRRITRRSWRPAALLSRRPTRGSRRPRSSPALTRSVRSECARCARRCSVSACGWRRRAELRSPAVGRALDARGVRVLGAYGQTEHLCVAMHHPDRVNFTTVGLPMPGTELRIADDGEVLVKRGPLTFSGYFGRDDETREAFTADGAWLKTGDLGNVDAEGFLRITGRKKEIPGPLHRQEGGPAARSRPRSAPGRGSSTRCSTAMAAVSSRRSSRYATRRCGCWRIAKALTMVAQRTAGARRGAP